MLTGKLGLAAFIGNFKLSQNGKINVMAMTMSDATRHTLDKMRKKYFESNCFSCVEMSGFCDDELDEAKM